MWPHLSDMAFSGLEVSEFFDEGFLGARPPPERRVADELDGLPLPCSRPTVQI
jgi:hypothetical protein